VTSREATYAAYAAIAAAIFVWQVVSAVRGRATLGRLWHWASSRRAGLVVGLLLWAWLGWHLFVRGTATFLH
jgi:hypothetical protein